MPEKAIQELRYSFRSLLNTPGFTAVAVLILALGIGVNSTMFALASALFLGAPPAVAEPERLVRINRTTDNVEAGSLGYPEYLYYRQHSRSLSELAAYDPSSIALTAGRGETIRTVDAWMVSDNYFRTLGAAPAAGRFFTREENLTPGTHPVAVISHGYWQRAYAGDASAIGAPLVLNGRSHTVIGVAPRGFRGVSPAEVPPDVWLPIMMLPAVRPSSSGSWLERVEGERIVWLWSLGRLAPDQSVETARAEMETLAARMAAAFPDWHEGEGAAVSGDYRFHPPVRDQLATLMTLLTAVAALVLLIAAVNLAILMLVRASARRTQIGVLAAVGAGRWQLVQPLLAESLLVALAGAVLGFLASYVTADLASALMPLEFAVGFEPDLRVLAFTLAAALAAGAVFAVVPALKTARTDIADSLRSGGDDGQRSLLRNGLVVAQVAIAIVVVLGAGLMVRSLTTIRAVELGFEPERNLAITVDPSGHGYTPEASRAYLTQALERLTALPGVETASAAVMSPFRGMWIGSFRHTDAPPETEGLNAGFNSVAPGYFSTLGIPLVAGREFARHDDATARRVVIVNETLATSLWPQESALGKRLDLGSRNGAAEVVGVAADATYYEIGETPHTQLYLPLAQAGVGRFQLLVRTAGDPAALAVPVRRALGELDPGLALANLRPLGDDIDAELGRFRVSAVLVGLFGLLALLLAAVGLYGVLSYLVVRRTREIGVRMALGAGRRRVAGTVVARGLKLAALGTALGTAAAFPFVGLIESFLYGVAPRDPLTFAIVPLILLAVAALASFVPARRATRVDPSAALRSE